MRHDHSGLRARRPAGAPLRWGTGLLLLVTAPAVAVDRVWIGATGGPPGDGVSFNDPLNWSPNGAPAAPDTAIFEVEGGTVEFGDPLTLNTRLRLRATPDPVTFDLAGLTYQLSAPFAAGAGRSIVVGEDAGSIVDLTLAAGEVRGIHGVVGLDATSDAVLTVSADAELTLAARLTGGDDGTGAVDLMGRLTAADVLLGASATGNGTIDANGATALWLVLDGLTVGAAGAGHVIVRDGALALVVGDVATATQFGAAADLLVAGAGTSWFVGGALSIGGDAIMPGGGATLDVEGGATVDVGDALTVWAAGGTTVTDGTITAPTLIVDGGTMDIAAAGRVIVSEVPIAPGNGLFVGTGAATGIVTIDGAGVLTAVDAFIGADVGGVADVVIGGTDSRLETTGGCDIGWAPEPFGGLFGDAVVTAMDDGGLLVGQTLTLRQNGRLRLDDARADATTLVLTDHGALAVDLDDPTGRPFVAASGVATLGGGLFATLDPTYVPILGDTFAAIVCASRVGTLTAVSTPFIPGFRFVDPTTTDTGVDLEIRRLGRFLAVRPPTEDALVRPANAVDVRRFDDDDLVDVVVTIPSAADDQPGQVQILVNTLPGPGMTPGFDVAADVVVGRAPSDVAAADVDGDADADVVVANAGDDTVTVLRNTGADPLLEIVQIVPVGGAPSAVALADIDGDGSPDLIVAGAADDAFMVVFNDGAGMFPAAGAIVVAAGTQPRTICPLDLDKDRDIDIVVVNLGLPAGSGGTPTPTVTVHLNLGAQGRPGVFARPVAYEVGLGPVAEAVGDLNGDGAADLAIANQGESTVSILLGNGDGTFRTQVRLPAGGAPRSIAMVDLDHDLGADLDLAVIVDTIDGPGLSVFRNDTTDDVLTLTLIENAEAVLGIPAAIIAGDLDDDGPDDLISVGAAAGASAGDIAGVISVFVAAPVSCIADVTGDGEVGPADLAALLAAFGPAPGSPFDLDGDGDVDADDLAILLSSWGTCFPDA